jgi:HAD superfamily, subfamily IIIB (Acid phosphatase)
MRRLLLTFVAALAVATPTASAATPPADLYAPPPEPILTIQDGTPTVQLNDGAGGLPYLGSEKSYNAGDWENVLRAFHDNGTYDAELNTIVNIADRYVLRVASNKGWHGHHGHHGHHGDKPHGHGAKARASHKGHGDRRKPAVVLDVDETSLSNYTAIEKDNFTFGPNSQAEATDKIGVAIAPTLKLFNDAKAAGVTVFFITGRGEAVRQPTEENLREQGFDGWGALYLKPPGSTLTTVQYKTAAREDIESKGYRIVANLGDQFSDLAGGHSKRGFKLPNPFYFLP